MTEVATYAEMATESMRPKGVDIGSTVMTKVRDTKWGPKVGPPSRRRPMAVQIVLSSMQRPIWNQAPDSYLEADKSLALDKASGTVARSSAATGKNPWQIPRFLSM